MTEKIDDKSLILVCLIYKNNSIIDIQVSKAKDTKDISLRKNELIEIFTDKKFRFQLWLISGFDYINSSTLLYDSYSPPQTDKTDKNTEKGIIIDFKTGERINNRTK